jgi:hypothetical protein
VHAVRCGCACCVGSRLQRDGFHERDARAALAESRQARQDRRRHPQELLVSGWLAGWRSLFRRSPLRARAAAAAADRSSRASGSRICCCIRSSSGSKLTCAESCRAVWCFR